MLASFLLRRSTASIEVATSVRHALRYASHRGTALQSRTWTAELECNKRMSKLEAADSCVTERLVLSHIVRSVGEGFLSGVAHRPVAASGWSVVSHGRIQRSKESGRSEITQSTAGLCFLIPYWYIAISELCRR